MNSFRMYTYSCVDSRKKALEILFINPKESNFRAKKSKNAWPFLTCFHLDVKNLHVRSSEYTHETQRWIKMESAMTPASKPLKITHFRRAHQMRKQKCTSGNIKRIPSTRKQHITLRHHFPAKEGAGQLSVLTTSPDDVRRFLRLTLIYKLLH